MELTKRLWPVEQADLIYQRVKNRDKSKPILLETGYGPSGLPHLGTFAEVARTTWVKNAFETLYAEEGFKTKLLVFSDDMDGLRSVPKNIVENQDFLREDLGKSLTSVRDPFGKFASFGEHNNAMLRSFLDNFGFEYEFASATDYYRRGVFNETLLKIANQWEEILDVIIPTLGHDKTTDRGDRKQTYSPLMPIHPLTGVVMQVPMDEVRPAQNELVWTDPSTGVQYTTPITDGHCKAQWKIDWALRWVTLGVDYEMSGKDLMESVKLSSRICRILGGEPPINLTYELFLDESGKKMSKSSGNGVTMEEFLQYGSKEALSYFIFHKPSTAKSISIKMIPTVMDEYLQDSKNALTGGQHWLEFYSGHIHRGVIPPDVQVPFGYGTMINMAEVTQAKNADLLIEFMNKNAGQDLRENLVVVEMARCAIEQMALNEPAEKRAPNDIERVAFQDLIETLKALPVDADEKTIQTEIYEVGKRHPFKALKDWFQGIYQVLLGRNQGPRFGNFVAVYGIPETIALIENTLKEEHQPHP